MPAHTRRLAALVTALALAAPGSAAAQSAGDDQYQDPFAGEAAPASGGGEQEEEEAPAVAAPEPDPAPAPAPAPAEAAAASAPAQLPYTGLDAGPILLAGTALLAGGVALRLRLRERR